MIAEHADRALRARLTAAWQRFVDVNAEVDTEDLRRGRLFNMLMLLSVGIALALVILLTVARHLGYFSNVNEARIGALFPLFFVPLSVFCYLRVKKGHVRQMVRLYVWFVYLGIVVAAIIFGGYTSAAWLLLFWPISIAGTLLQPRAAIYFAFASLGIYGVLAAIESQGWYVPPLGAGLETFRFMALAFTLLMLFMTTGGLTYLNNRSLKQALTHLQTTSRELELAQQDLAQRVEARTAELRERAEQFRTIAEVGQAAASILEFQVLLDTVVELIGRRLDFYHVGIFLLDPEGRWAVLRAASSEGGLHMLARGHRLRVGQQGIVGYVAETGTARVALDVGADAVFFNNPDLPETKSEIALPLIVANKTIGVLDIQTREAAAFDEDDVEVLHVLADGVAVAIQNTQLMDETRTTLEQLERYRETDAVRAWRQALSRRHMRLHYQYASGVVQSVDAADTDGHVKDAGNAVTRDVAPDGRHLLLAPISVGGRKLGVLSFERSTPWSDETVQLVEAVTAQLDLALNNARLLEETRLRATQEAARSEIVGRIRTLTSTDAILRNAAEELGRALQVERSRIQLVQVGE